MKFRAFHKESGVESIPEDRALMQATQPEYKLYDRFDQIALPHPSHIEMSLSSAIEKRASALTFDASKTVGIEALSTILFSGAGRTDRSGSGDSAPRRRHQPSGGGLYPIECYVAAYRIESLKEAAYHYEVPSHTLAQFPFDGAAKKIRDASNALIPDLDPAAIIVLSALWERTYPKYGEFAYRLGLIEAGHMAQNMLLSAAARGIAARPIAGFRTRMIAQALDIASDNEDPLYLLYVGR